VVISHYRYLIRDLGFGHEPVLSSFKFTNIKADSWLYFNRVMRCCIFLA
jgi:hypothetical protein